MGRFLHTCAILALAILPCINSMAAGRHELSKTSQRFPRSPNIVPLVKRNKRDAPSDLNRRTGSTMIRPATEETQYLAEVKFDGVPRYLLIDTGSSDTWMTAEHYVCENANGTAVPEAVCNLAEPYTGPPLDPVDNVTYWQLYGSGETIRGGFYRAKVELAGITVKRQQVALVEQGYVVGGGARSGVLGLAPNTTGAAYKGNISSTVPAPQTAPEPYTTVFESMYNRTGQIDALFSLALERGPCGGYLAFGGLPPIDFTPDFTTVDLKGINIGGKFRPAYYYPIEPDGFELDGQAFNTSYRVVVDSGTFVCRLPQTVADQFNAAFDPPAVYDPELQVYTTLCNATSPEFGLRIGGKTFHFQQGDILLQLPGLSIGGRCATGITRGFSFQKDAFPDGFFVVGDTFLHNVVAVFDVGHAQMHFAAR